MHVYRDHNLGSNWYPVSELMDDCLSGICYDCGPPASQDGENSDDEDEDVVNASNVPLLV